MLALWCKNVVAVAVHLFLIRPPPISGATHGASVTTRRVEILCSLCSLRASRLLPLQIGIRSVCGLPAAAAELPVARGSLGLFLVVQTLTQT